LKQHSIIFKFINIITSLKLLNDIENYKMLKILLKNIQNYYKLLNNIQNYWNIKITIIIRIIELFICYWIIFNIIQSN